MMVGVPWAFIPPALVLDGWVGSPSNILNGQYTLQRSYVYGYPTWAKQSPGGNKVAFILRDYCGAWLISPYRDGKRKNCNGWASADARECGAEPGGRPWECTGNWTVSRKDWLKDPSVVVTPALETGLDACSPNDEARVIKKFGKIDIVIPWINGSDPSWLKARRQTCEDYHWERHWPDAVATSPNVQRCLQQNTKIDTQAGNNLSAGPDVTTKKSRCFQKFIESSCVKRLETIAYHDELRYLLRSLEQHLWWHSGRIVIVVPRRQRPGWLVPSDRLQVLTQEELIEAAMASPFFKKTSRTSFAPSRIFNDFPVELSLPFLNGASETIMLLQDDIIFARPVKPCELFSREGLQLFAWTYEHEDIEDAYTEAFAHMLLHTAHFWENFIGSSNSSVTPVPFYRIFHAPVLLSVPTLEVLWRLWPGELSTALDSAFRHPWLLDIVGLHHTWVAQRSREARVQNMRKTGHDNANTSGMFDTVSTSRIVDVTEFYLVKEPMPNLIYARVAYKNLSEWVRQMRKLKPEPAELPMTISFQDEIVTAGGQTPELDCLQERWLTKLLPNPASMEDPSKPPSSCESLRDLHKPLTKHLPNGDEL